MAGMIKVLWIFSAGLQFAVFFMMAWKKRHREFPAVFAYLLVGLAQNSAAYLVYSLYGYRSWPAFWTGWISQAMVVIARWVAVCELCRNVLGQFQGIWALAWRALVVLGSLALLFALVFGGHDFVRLVSTFDLGLELSMATVLVAFFLFARYYKVQIQYSLRSIGIAFSLYAVFRAFNDLVLQTFLRDYANTWNLVDEVTYILTLILLGSAVYVLRPESVQKAVLLPQAVYTELAPQINERLEALNERLGQLLSSKKKGQA